MKTDQLEINFECLVFYLLSLICRKEYNLTNATHKTGDFLRPPKIRNTSSLYSYPAKQQTGLSLTFVIQTQQSE